MLIFFFFFTLEKIGCKASFIDRAVGHELHPHSIGAGLHIVWLLVATEVADQGAVFREAITDFQVVVCTAVMPFDLKGLEGKPHVIPLRNGNPPNTFLGRSSYTAKKPLPRMLLLLRNSTQSRLSVETRGSGTLSPQNLPGKGKRTVRLLADGKEGLSTSREREDGAASDEVQGEQSSPGTHPVALKDEKLERKQ